MFGWFTGNNHKKHDEKDKDIPSAPRKQPDPLQQQQLKYKYEEAHKLHIERLHEQRVEEMKKQTIYKDVIWSAVVIDWDNLYGDNLRNNSNNNMENKPNVNIPISSILNDETDLMAPIPTTNIGIEMDMEENAMLLIETMEIKQDEEKKEMDERLEQYKKRQELKDNIKETMHKTAVFSKYAWKKSVAFTTNATSAFLSATNNVLTKIEDAKKENNNNDSKDDDEEQYNDEGQTEKNKKNKKNNHSGWGFLDINKYKKKKNEDHDKNVINKSTFNPYET